MFDAASRYLLFPLKRAVADALLPHLEMVSPAELCHWLILADMYAVAYYPSFCKISFYIVALFQSCFAINNPFFDILNSSHTMSQMT